MSRSAALLLSCRSLSGLAGWQPVDALVERTVDAVRGVGGLDRVDRDRLLRWVRVWQGLHPDIRRFYTAALAEREDHAMRAVDSCLSAILDGHQAPDWARGTMARLHVSIFGYDAGFSLCPHPSLA